MPSNLHNFKNSPFARRRGLLARKVRERLFGKPKVAFREVAPVYNREPLAPVCEALRNWATACDVTGETLPLTRVFDQDFDLKTLLEASANGPKNSQDLPGDIKLGWEFSRAYALPLNALRNEFDIGFVRDWLAANEDPDGPAWTCAMEVAIRAVNWIVADALLDGRIEQELGEAVWRRTIWNHGYFIERRLESRLVSSNHYLADLLGLAFIGACFPEDGTARKWVRLAEAEFPAALRAQVFHDGSLYEASVAYHGLVLEMALWFRVLTGKLHEALVHRMAQCVADLERHDGSFFQVGDNDSGRIIAMDLIAPKVPRGRSVHLLAEGVMNTTYSRVDRADYPDAGWWVADENPWLVLLAYGGVGMVGVGAHAHNDTMSVCFDYEKQPVLVDPGSYIYTPDPESRNRFRSTRSHNSFLLDDQEHRAIPGKTAEGMFHLPGPYYPIKSKVVPDGIHTSTKIPTKKNFLIEVGRSVRVDEKSIEITDDLKLDCPTDVVWSFHLAPGVTADVTEGLVLLTLPSGPKVRLSYQEVTVSLETYDFSPSYGNRIPATVIRAGLTAEEPIEMVWRFDYE